MPRRMMELSVSIAANTSNSNVLSGKLFERVPNDCFVQLLATGSAAGLEQQLLISGQAVTDQGPVNTGNRQPVVPDDEVISNALALAGSQLVLKVTNTTAGALTYRARVNLDDAVRM